MNKTSGEQGKHWACIKVSIKIFLEQRKQAERFPSVQCLMTILTCHALVVTLTLLWLYITTFVIPGQASYLVDVSYKYNPIRDVFMSKTLATSPTRGHMTTHPHLSLRLSTHCHLHPEHQLQVHCADFRRYRLARYWRKTDASGVPELSKLVSLVQHWPFLFRVLW